MDVVLPVVAGVLVLILIACLSWVWRRLHRIPEPPNKLQRILTEDAAQSPMTCREARQYFDLHDVFGGDGD